MTQASAERSWNVAIRAQGAEALELTVYDVIGSSLFEDGITSKDVLTRLRAAPKAKKIDLRVNSIGGLVDEAKAMVNLLSERASAGVEIVGWVDGLAASSAAYLLTAAQRVVMPANAFQMIHGVRGGVRGTAEDVEAGAQLMRRTNEQLAEAFAAASARRGKGKTKEDFLAAFAAGDLYLDADEAIAWGLADEKLEAVKLAACLADLSGIDGAPEALRTAPYVLLEGQALQTNARGEITGRTVPAPQPTTPPSPVARADQQPPNGEEKKTMSQATVLNLVAIATVLGFTAEAAEKADEQAITAAIGKLKNSARVGIEIEKLVKVSGDAAIGAVRALQASQERVETLTVEVGKVKAQMSRSSFEAAREQGLKDKKLTPAVAKMYSDRFDASLASGEDGASVVADLQGFLAVAPRIATTALPPVSGAGGDPTTLRHNGKTYAELKPVEKARLAESDPDLFKAMRADHQQRVA